MSSEIRQRQTAEVVPVVPVEPSATTPVETAVETQHAGRRSSLLRNLLLLLLAAGALLGYQQGLFGGSEKPKVIYASRYSDEYKFRPAASPVITETLADGRIRLRGASPAGVGIDASELPKTPQQLAKERQAAQDEALEAAKRQLGIKSRKKKEKSNLEILREQGIPMANPGQGGGGAGPGGLGGRGSGAGQMGGPMGGKGKGTAIRGGRKGIKVRPGQDGKAL